MALVLGSSSRAPQRPEDSLKAALQEFQCILSKEQQTELHKIKAVPDGDAVTVFTATLDDVSRSRRGRSIATRLHTVLQSAREFCTIVDTFVSSNPEIAALVWGSIKLAMKIAINYTSYFEPLSNIFMQFKDHCPRFADYQALFPSSTRLQEALCEFHASIIRCCKHVLRVLQRPVSMHVINALWRSVDEEFKPDIVDIKHCGDEVREAIYFAKAQADVKAQKFQEEENKIMSKFRALATSEGEERKQWQLQQNLLHKAEQRNKLLERLSSHDYRSAFHEACKKRHHSTGEWIFSTPDFKAFRNHGPGSSLLWCSGKIGSGKTVLTTSVIEHALSNKTSQKSCVTFFFVRYDDPRSLKAETILRSIIRQSIDPIKLSGEMEKALEELDQKLYPKLEDLIAVLQQRLKELDFFDIFIDGLDECDLAEQRALLKSMSLLCTTPLVLRFFLASRESLNTVYGQKFAFAGTLSMGSSGPRSEISLFVKQEIQERRKQGDLVVGVNSLVEDIQRELIQHADGMFLWVGFLIDEICTKRSDAEIRQCLRDLPKDLEATFTRTLLRIVSRKNEAIVQRAFPWVAAAKRNLTVDELNGAISTDIGQAYWESKKRINGLERITTWSENLLQVDEELETVHFAHRSIYDFITTAQLQPQVSPFHVDLHDADHNCGEICMTYLHFNDFKTTLARRTQPMRVPMPADIAQTALGRHRHVAKVKSSLQQLGLTLSRGKVNPQLDVVGALASYQRVDVDEALVRLQQSHPFLSYAAEYWIAHTTTFAAEKSTTWSLWRHVVLDGHNLAKRPWPRDDENPNALEILIWSLETRHKTLVRFLNCSGGLPRSEVFPFMKLLAKEDDLELFDILLEKAVDKREAGKLLQICAGKGPMRLIERLLAAGADVNTQPAVEWGRTALQAASEGGHLEAIERLLAAGADVNAEPAVKWGRTALQAASEGGHLEAIEWLLAAGADINAKPAEEWGQTALQAASEGGHLEIMERLKLAGASR